MFKGAKPSHRPHMNLSDENDKGTDTFYLMRFSLSGTQILKITYTNANSCSKRYLYTREYSNIIYKGVMF